MGCNSSSSRVEATETNLPNDESQQFGQELSSSEIDDKNYISDPNISSNDWRDVVSFRTFFNQKDEPQIFEYLFLKPIGRGAQAEVYLVQNTETKEMIAAKVYAKDYLFRKNLGDAIQPVHKVVREIQIMNDLKHINCIRMVEVLDDEYTNSIILLQEYADKGPLLPQKSKTDPFPEAQAKDIFFQICQGVQYLHANNIVHRDIKPENILTFKNGRVAVGDFSASVRLQKPDEYLEDTDGTPAFYSPEQVTGQPFKGKPGDVWACGVSLYIMLYGRLPFFDVSETGYSVTQFFRLSQQIQSDPVVFDDDKIVSDDAKDLILHCLDKNPDTRYTIEDVLRHKWFSDLPNYQEVIDNMYPLQPIYENIAAQNIGFGQPQGFQVSVFNEEDAPYVE